MGTEARYGRSEHIGGPVARVRLTMGAMPPSPRSAGEQLPRLGENFGVNLDALPGALDQP